ncbi:MAG: threonine synthase [Desulfomonilia bacterium]
MMGELTCPTCRAVHALDDIRWRCDCGSFLDISFQPSLERKKIASRKPTMWRYREAIPVRGERNIVTFDEGFTPLLRVMLDGYQVFITADHLFPCFSYKDRGASVLVSKVRELGIRAVVEDSSGNAGGAIAAYCAGADIPCMIFVPADTSPGKLAQIRAYGAQLKRVPGTREDTARAVMLSARASYYASHAWNPFFFQGTKTFAYKVWEQLGWKTPDSIVLPAGNGTLVLGAFLGFTELRRAGMIDEIPRIIAVQSEQCAPLYEAFTTGAASIPHVEKSDTLAEGIAIADPVRGMQVIQAVRSTHGDILKVSDAEIMAYTRKMWHLGHYIEIPSGAAIAGTANYLKSLKDDEVIVTVFTGSGLKSTEKILRVLDSPAQC